LSFTFPGICDSRAIDRRTWPALAAAQKSSKGEDFSMHVGTTVIFQGQGEGRTDREVYRNDLHLGELAEPLGFDSLWGVEHHFTDYTMCPDVLQYLTYFAGRTQRIRLGSMVVVLPWHHPMRVAEQVSMLDHMSNGRLILGIGRGVARVEFGGFGVDQQQPRYVRRIRPDDPGGPGTRLLRV
jgi:hypothetical protein